MLRSVFICVKFISMISWTKNFDIKSLVGHWKGTCVFSIFWNIGMKRLPIVNTIH